jgi:phage-related minor tail protein
MAKGGIVNSPTLFPFAKGTGLMGEAGSEAIMPLQRGADGKLGVLASGGGGGDVNVVVNVDAKGSSVEGDEQGANQLGRVISAAVQSELIKQQRPGGILAR